MKITYQTTFVGQCPVDDSIDVYALTVESDQFIPVEDILGAIKTSTQPGAVYQEDIHESLSARLTQATSITIVGTHSGVLTTVTS